MKRVGQSIFGVIAVVGLAVAVIWLVRSASGQQEMMAQVTPQPIETEEIQVTGTPTSALDNQNNSSEPTATPTPVIILPEGTSPPIPTPLPTPTATPINPKESILMSFDVPASLGEISPDGKTLAFNLWEVETKDNPYNQVWLMDLNTKQSTKLVEVGKVDTSHVWAPDSQKIAYQISDYEEMEVRVVDIAGHNDRSLLKSKDLFGYYWVNSEQMGLIRASSIDQVDFTGRTVEKQPINLRTAPSGAKPQIAGSPQNDIATIEDGILRIVSSNGQKNIIRASQGEQIFEFALSPNGQQVAYVTSQDTGTAFWVSDLAGNNPRKLLEQAGENRANISNPVWSPNNQAVVLILSEFGTSSNLKLVWIDIKNEKITPLQVDNLTRNIIFSPDGQFLYYTRISDSVVDPPWGKGTFYQLRLK